MGEQKQISTKSRELTLALYDRWVRGRQKRKSLEIPEGKDAYKKLGTKNFINQLVESRKHQLKQMKEVGKEISMADKVALLVMMELPVLETSSLLHKLSMQLAEDAHAPYFSKHNQDCNCGCGCGCCCGSMDHLPYEERIQAHLIAKPYSIDPFNELGVSEKERDELLIRDFLESYEALSVAVAERVNKRSFNIGREFS